MSHRASTLRPSNLRAYAAVFISYLMIAGQVAPLTLGAAPRTPARTAAESEAPPAAETAAATIAARPQPAPLAFAGPNVTATKRDEFPDSNNDLKAEPGETITYTVTITNTGDADAEGVTFNDTVDPNTTLIENSLAATPIANHDTYNVIANVRIQPDASQGVLANDRDTLSGNTGSGAGLTASGPNTAPTNGQLTLNSNGSFSYNPNPGFTGTDTFTYTVTDSGGRTATATVTLRVGDGAGSTTGPVIWFIRAGADAGGDGRLTNPYNCYTGANAPGVQTCFSASANDQNGDSRFLFAGSYTGGDAMLPSQKLLGQGMRVSLATAAGVTVQPYSDPLPPNSSDPSTVTIAAAGGTAVPLSTNNTLRGFTVGNTTTDISGTSFGTLTAADVILNGTGQTLALSTGTLAATFDSISTTSSAGPGLSLSGVAGTMAVTDGTSISGHATQGITVSTTTANVNFGNTAVSGGTVAISLSNNSAGTRSFGTITTSGNTGVAFDHTAAGGAVNVTGATSITNPGGVGINIQNSTTPVSFAATTVDKGLSAGNGVSLGTNSGNTTFTALAVTTSAGTGLLGTNNTGQINVTTNAGSISATAGPAIDISKASAPATPITLNFNAVTSTNSLGKGVNLNRVSGNLTAVSTTVGGATGSAGIGIDVQNSGTGTANAVTLNFGNTNVTGSAGTGVNLAANTAAVTFNALNISPDSTVGAFSATNNTGTLTSASGTINAASSHALSIVGTDASSRTPLALTLTSLTSTDSTSASGGVDLNFVSGNLTVGTAGGGVDTTVTNPSQFGIRVRNSGSGTLNFRDANVTLTGSTGVILGTAGSAPEGANAGNVTFGDLDITTDANQRALQATNNTGTITTTSGTISNSGATAIDINGPSGLTPLAMVLTSVTSSGGTANGIRIEETSGSFSIVGDGSNTTAGGNASGGTISGKSGADGSTTSGIGIYLDNVTNISLRRIRINGVNQNFGIRGFRVNNFTLEYSTVGSTTPTNTATITANQQGDNINGIGEGSVYFGSQTNGVLGLTGTGTFTSNFISAGASNNMQVSNGGGTLNRLTITGTTFGYNSILGAPNIANAALTVVANRPSSGNTVLNSTVTGNTFVGSPGDAANFTGQEPTTSLGISMDTIFQNNTITNNHPQNNVGSRSLTVAGFSNTTFNVSNNTMSGADNSAIVLQMGAPVLGSTVATSLSGTVNGNTIGVPATLNSGSKTGNGIFVSLADNKTAPKGVATLAITNNQIYQYRGNAGIFADNTGGDYNVNATITGNTTANPGSGGPMSPPFAGLALTAGAPGTTDDIDVCASVTGNDFSQGDPGNSNDIIVGVSGANSSMRLPGFTPNGTLAAVVAYIKNNNLNPAATAVSVYDDLSATGASFTGGATPCTSPSTLVAEMSPKNSPESAVAPTGPEPKPSDSLAAPAYVTPLAVRLHQMRYGTTPPPAPQRPQTVPQVQNDVPAAGPSGGAAPAVFFLNLPQSDPTPDADAEKKDDEEKEAEKDAAKKEAEQAVNPADSPAEAVKPAEQQPAPAEESPAEAAPVAPAPAAPAQKKGPAAPKPPAKAPSKRDGGTTLRHTAEDSGAPLAAGSFAAAQKTSPRTPVSSPGPVSSGAVSNTITVNVGTLAPGRSVTITFQVTVNNPYTGGPNVSNQGRVSGSNFSTVNGISTSLPNTDDPDTLAAGDPTLTPINSINIRVNDARVGEPASNSTPMVFTVALSAPATGPVSVNYATADGGSNPATGGPASTACDGSFDYESTSGTLNFSVGQKVKTVSVNVCADANAAETDETLLLNLSGAVGGTIVDSQAVGTITPTNAPGTLLISELRTSGPDPDAGGPKTASANEFVEVYNNTDSSLTIPAGGYGVFKLGAGCDATPVLVGTIPQGTVIPARGHFLLTGSGYGLENYGGTNAALGDGPLTSDIENDANIALFSTTDVNLLSTDNRLDAVGFGGNTGSVCNLMREGTNLGPASGSTLEHTYFRKQCDYVAGVGCTVPGNPKDTNDNSADFFFADTSGTEIVGTGRRLGAPGPENMSSPIRRDSTIGFDLLDAHLPSAAPPNRVRTFTQDPGNQSTHGTISIRRRITNNGADPLSRIRFRIVEITTFPQQSPDMADLRARSSSDTTANVQHDSVTCQSTASPSSSAPCTVSVKGTTLEQPPNQPLGGGYNATMTVNLGTPLQPGQSINVQFLLGLEETGRFRFYVITEALP